MVYVPFMPVARVGRALWMRDEESFAAGTQNAMGVLRQHADMAALNRGGSETAIPPDTITLARPKEARIGEAPHALNPSCH